ncbi:MAG: stage II sporulation protein M [Candidatus Micrarchaeia archaeon]|jgi:uncharacterized membrane protein SpoIIM required for sporulation
MVLELLVSPHKAKREPWDLAILAFVFVSVGVGLRVMLPSMDGSPVVFAMVPAIPLLWTLLVREEREDEEFHRHNRGFFDYHADLIEIFGFFFIGASIAYTAWYVLLPPETAAAVFESQLDEIKLVQGAMSAATAAAFKPETFQLLFYHNLQVLALMFVFSLVYGIGSIYLLLWNASVIGVFVGTYVHSGGLAGVINAILGLIPHGSLEIIAYFIASISGGILSVAIARHRWQHPEFKYVMLDVLLLAAVSVILLVLGALLESSY